MCRELYVHRWILRSFVRLQNPNGQFINYSREAPNCRFRTGPQADPRLLRLYCRARETRVGRSRGRRCPTAVRRSRRPSGGWSRCSASPAPPSRLQQTMVIPLLPGFQELMHISTDNVSWLVTATLVTSAVATPVVARLADSHGKRLMMLVCIALMTVGSLIAALSAGSFVVLLTGRSLQGFSAALIPVGISILRDELPKERVGSAVALMSATLGIGGALGLPLGWHLLPAVRLDLGLLGVRRGRRGHPGRGPGRRLRVRGARPGVVSTSPVRCCSRSR